MNETWKPIATAPGDTHILIASSKVVCSAILATEEFGDGSWNVHPDFETWFFRNPPTHWQPLPEPPSA